MPKAKIFPAASETECPESENGSHEALEIEKYSKLASSSVLGKTSEKNGKAAQTGTERSETVTARKTFLKEGMGGKKKI